MNLIGLKCACFYPPPHCVSSPQSSICRRSLCPIWQCYMSPQGRRYYVNTTSNGKRQWNATSVNTWSTSYNVPNLIICCALSFPTLSRSLFPHSRSLSLSFPTLVLSPTLSLSLSPHPSLSLSPPTPLSLSLPPPLSLSLSPHPSFSLSPHPPLPSLSLSLTQINCVTFPSLACMPEQQLLKPNEWSYCDFFWTDKKDPQSNGCITGFEVLLQKQLKGKQMQKEMAEFIRERIKIEEEYAKNLSKLSQIPLASQEEGTLGEAWAQLKRSLADEAEVHLKFSSKLQSEVEKPFLAFRENFKKDMKRFDHHIADLRKQLVGRYAAVEKAHKALADRQKELDLKTQQLEIKLSNKIEEDIKKARRKSTQAGDDLMRCVDLYNQSQSKWFEEMVTTSLELERLEVERVEMIRQHLCQYTTLRHETDMFNQSTMEPVDQLLQCVDPAKDRERWVRENMTGEIRPVDIEI
uniref:Growth arrest specific 7 n=1 Tax=Cyclopterus lumpus TaxID=8103 RepID=A0A8C2ZU10_CYCLU